jgi:low temperature requirement protein LtrA
VSEVQQEEKRVTWAELFFDLVFVVAVTRLATAIEHHHDPLGLLRALVVFVPIYWTWVGSSILANQQDVSRPGLRVRLFAVALAGVFMSMSLGHAYEDAGVVFAVAYWAGRVVLGSTILRAVLRGQGTPFNPYMLSMFLTGPVLVVGSLLDAGPRLAVWGAAALLDLASPTLFRFRMRGMHLDAAHFAERFGLFVLIALGESVVAVGTSADVEHLGWAEAGAVTAAFVLSCGLWWVYFQFAADAVRHALATAAVQLDIARLVLSYGHLVFIASVIVVSVGMHDSVAHPTERLGWAVTGLLYGGAAAYLATFGFTRWVMFRLVSWTRLSAAAAVLVLLPAVHGLPALAALVLLAVVLVALNALEWWMVDRIGWRARQAARDAEQA